MVSPKAKKVGWYNPELLQVKQLDANALLGVLTPKAQHRYRRSMAETTLPLCHVQVDDLTLADALALYRGQTKPVVTAGETYYLRTLNGTAYTEPIWQVLESIPGLPVQTVATVNYFVSPTDMVTTTHYDGRSGLIVQVRGQKEVWLFAHRAGPYLDRQPEDHLLKRRTQVEKRLSSSDILRVPAGLRKRYLLKPGQWLFVPAGMYHYVRSLSDPAVTVIVRLKV